MALTETEQIPLGYSAPEFSLVNTIDDETVSFGQVRGERGTVVMFICNHCPYVVHVRDELVRLANDYMSKGIGFVAISSNDIVNYPDDRPELMRQLAHELSFPFPYLYDESQEVARSYKAACTPDFSVFDAEDRCVYRGRLDASTPGNGKPVTGEDLRDCLDSLLRGDSISEEQFPSMGCNIKWK